MALALWYALTWNYRLNLARYLINQFSLQSSLCYRVSLYGPAEFNESNCTRKSIIIFELRNRQKIYYQSCDIFE